MSALSGLEVRLAMVTLVVGLVGGVAGGWVALDAERDSTQDEAKKLTVGLAERLANEIDSRVEGLAQSLRVLTTREGIFGLGDRVGVELTVALRSLTEVAELDAYDATGTLIAAVATDRLIDPSRVQAISLAGLDRQRTELEPTPPSLIDITVPIEDPPGTVIGALRGRIRLEVVVRALEARLLGSSAKAIFVGSDGVILDHPERNRVITAERYPIASIPPGTAVTLDREGVSVFAAFATASISGLPGAVITEWDRTEALARTEDQARLIGLLVALIVLVTVAVVFVLASRLLRPLGDLRQVLHRLGAGERDARVREAGSAEFREVARDVNAMATSISEQMSKVEEAEQRFRRIISSSPDVFIVVDEAGRIELASGRVADMFGYSPDALVGRPVEDLVPERSRAVHRDHRRSHRQDDAREMGTGLALTARRADGSEFRVEISLNPIVMDHKPRVLATVRDVTERLAGEAAEQELRDVRERQRQAIEINDNIVQGLTIARWSFDLDDTEAARRAVERTVETARLLVDRMLSATGSVEPGALRRDLPAGPER